MAKVDLNDDEKRAFKKAYDNKCYLCKQQKASYDLDIDHIIPPNKREQAINEKYINSQFDVDAYYNYACICKNCNSTKSDILLPVVSVFVEKAKQKIPQVKSELTRSRKRKLEDQEDEIIKLIHQWNRSGALSTPKIHNELSHILHKSIKNKVTNIIVRPESAIEIIDNKLITNHELDNFRTKIQTSQEMVFGYGNTSCLVLEEGIQFYPLSIYRFHGRLYKREFFTQNQKELMFELNFYAILLKDNKAVLISISNIDVGFDNLDYKEEIEPSYQLPLFDTSNPFDEIIRQMYSDHGSFWSKIRRNLLELTNVSRIVMQYIRELFKDVNE